MKCVLLKVSDRRGGKKRKDEERNATLTLFAEIWVASLWGCVFSVCGHKANQLFVIWSCWHFSIGLFSAQQNQCTLYQIVCKCQYCPREGTCAFYISHSSFSNMFEWIPGSLMSNKSETWSYPVVSARHLSIWELFLLACRRAIKMQQRQRKIFITFWSTCENGNVLISNPRVTLCVDAFIH